LRKISALEITETVSRLCQEANFDIGDDVINSLKKAKENEKSPTGKGIIEQILENIEISHKEKMPACQDTGYAVVFVDLGEEVEIEGGSLNSAIIEGVKKGYEEGYLRKSIVEDPFERKNTGDNTPPIIHLRFVPGDKMKIIVAPKGGGSENMSTVKMLTPAHGEDGVVNTVVEWVEQAGGNPCPPVHVGVAVGGTFEYCAYLAKRALLRPIGEYSDNPDTARIEKRILEEINKTGVGPMGLGGTSTALWVAMERYPCHIASMPMAINLNCHCSRHKEAVL
jgi:fumarate hydratase subunit alpha